MSRIDMTGQRVGRLVVVSFAGSTRSGAMWLCRCDCGKETVARGSKMRSGRAASCGCGVAIAQTTHGMNRTPTYRTWSAILERCLNEKSTTYRRYGGRGITVCDRWRSFANFLADMGERPVGTSIDRIDVNGHYEPGNCRWATAQEQSRNRRNTVLSIDDVKRAIALSQSGLRNKDIAERLGVSAGLVGQTLIKWRRGMLKHAAFKEAGDGE